MEQQSKFFWPLACVYFQLRHRYVYWYFSSKFFGRSALKNPINGQRFAPDGLKNPILGQRFGHFEGLKNPISGQAFR
jgi:hypothetical protein